MAVMRMRGKGYWAWLVGEGRDGCANENFEEFLA